MHDHSNCGTVHLHDTRIPQDDTTTFAEKRRLHKIALRGGMPLHNQVLGTPPSPLAVAIAYHDLKAGQMPFSIPFIDLKRHAMQRKLREGLRAIGVTDEFIAGATMHQMNALIGLTGAATLAAKMHDVSDEFIERLQGACRDFVMSDAKTMLQAIADVGYWIPGFLPICARALDMTTGNLVTAARAGQVDPVDAARMIGLQLVDEYGLESFLED